MSPDVTGPWQDPAIKGWLLYDFGCGFCRQWVPFWEKTLRKRGFAIAPLQKEWVAEQLQLPREELLGDLRLLLRDAVPLQGAEVYRYVMRRIWWAYPVYLLSIAPIFRQIFSRGYRMFATHRHKISDACGLERGR